MSLLVALFTLPFSFPAIAEIGISQTLEYGTIHAVHNFCNYSISSPMICREKNIV